MSQPGPLDDATVFQLKLGFINVSVIFVVYGIYTTMAVVSLHKLISRGLRKSIARQVLVSVVLLMWSITTTFAVLQLCFETIQLPTLGPNPPDITNVFLGIQISNGFLIRVNYILSDCVVVWRTWVIWSESRTARILLVFLIVASTACTFVDQAYAVLLELGKPTLSQQTRSTILAVPLLTTNLVATSMIAYKAWIYRTEIRAHLRHITSSSAVEKVLILLVESGFLYCAYWIFWLVTGFVSNEDQVPTGYLVVIEMAPLISAIYPTAIILLVAYERDQLENHSLTALSQSIRFTGFVPRDEEKQLEENSNTVPASDSSGNRHASKVTSDSYEVRSYGESHETQVSFAPLEEEKEVSKVEESDKI